MRQRLVRSTLLFTMITMSPLAASASTQTVDATKSSDVWWIPLASALIGAIAALVTPVMKDVFINKWSERRIKLDRQRDIFRNYAAPLTASTEKLVWRLSEVFIDNRHQFLKTASRPLVYNDYKRLSTLYRIASILGWIRAIHLELSALPRGAAGFLTPISDAIRKAQGVLADGDHVEVHRLEQLCTVWMLDISSITPERKKILATKTEITLYNLAGDELKHDSGFMRSMNREDKSKICFHLAEFLCNELQRAPLAVDVIDETVAQAVAAMSYREALIYRDWQDAIGDAMLESDTDSVRRYRIIGFQKFEVLLKSDTLWMETFRTSINDIDFDSADPSDFRALQLRDLSAAAADILIAVAQTDDKDLIGEEALQIAQKLKSLAH